MPPGVSAAQPHQVNEAGAQVEFRDVQMRYREHLPKVLHGLSVTVPPGSRCGVVRACLAEARSCAPASSKPCC